MHPSPLLWLNQYGSIIQILLLKSVGIIINSYQQLINTLFYCLTEVCPTPFYIAESFAYEKFFTKFATMSLHHNISATILTLNEESRIGACIDSLAGIADEIIVVDSGSTDSTVSICRSKGCRVVERPMKGYGAQRQYATSLASHTYVLAIDADEELSPAVRDTLMALKREGFSHRGYAFSRLNFLLRATGEALRLVSRHPSASFRSPLRQLESAGSR